jgi:hypothetical protein
MKLVMTLLVRDEQDILADNLRFHLDRGVDHFIVTDNLSVDGTRDILRDYEAQSLVTYIHQPEDTYAQHAWVTRMAREAVTEHGADWVINNDSDEFWWPEAGDLKTTLSAVDARWQAVSVARSNFPPRHRADSGHFAEVMTVREARSLNALGNPLPPKVCHRGFADIEVEQGAHGVWRKGERLEAGEAPIIILHFPARTYSQFANKIAKGGAAYARNAYLPPGVGSTWRKLSEVLKQGGLPEYFDSLCLDQQEVNEGLAAGSLIYDPRLRDALRELNARSGSRLDLA